MRSVKIQNLIFLLTVSNNSQSKRQRREEREPRNCRIVGSARGQSIDLTDAGSSQACQAFLGVPFRLFSRLFVKRARAVALQIRQTLASDASWIIQWNRFAVSYGSAGVDCLGSWWTGNSRRILDRPRWFKRIRIRIR